MTARARTAPIIDAGVVALGGLIATAVAWPIHQHPQAVLVGVVGTFVGVSIAASGRYLRLPWWADALAAVAAYLVLAVPLAVPWLFPGQWLDGLRDAALGVVLGWKQLATLDLPLGDYQAVLVPLFVVTLFGSYAATRVAAAGRAAILMPLILFAMTGFGIAFGTSEILSSAPYRSVPTLPLVQELLGPLLVVHVLVVAVVLLVLVTIAWFAVRARQSRRAALARASGVAQARVRVHRGSAVALLRRGGLAAGMVVVALVVAGAVALPAVGLDRVVVRDGVQPLALTTPVSSELGAYRQWFQDERFDAELFAVEAGPEVERLRLVVLDAYDGTRFHVGDPEGASRFTRLAGAALVGGGALAPSEVRIELAAGYTGPWVPLPGDLASTAAFPVDRERAILLEDSVYYAVDGSNVVVVGDGGQSALRAGDAVVVSGTPVPDARTRIAAAEGGDPRHGVDAERFPELARWLESQEPQAGGQGLLEVIDALRARGYLSHALVGADDARWVEDAASRVPGFEFKESRSGHAVSRIEALFAQLTERQRQVVGAAAVVDPSIDEATLVAGIGDDEQFAAAGALLAWALGFEARVVVGVHLAETEAMRPPGGGPPAVEACAVQDGRHVCAGRNAAAWIEVQLGDEWVPLDTSPQFRHPPQENREGELPPPHGTQPERPQSAVIDPPNAAPAEGDPGAAPDDPPAILPAQLSPFLRALGLSVAALGLVLLPPGLLLAAKALRRHRRRADDPETSIVGAWDELVDLAIDHRAVGGSNAAHDSHMLEPEAIGVGRGATRSRVAARIGGAAGAEAARLAALADLAVFGDRTPNDAQAEHAWELVAAARTHLRDGVPFWERVRAALDPTSLVRRLRPPAAEGSVGDGARGAGAAGDGAGNGSGHRPWGPSRGGSRGAGPGDGRISVAHRGVRLAGEVN